MSLHYSNSVVMTTLNDGEVRYLSSAGQVFSTLCWLPREASSVLLWKNSQEEQNPLSTCVFEFVAFCNKEP